VRGALRKLGVPTRREAARRAAERIRARLAELRGREQDEELHYRLADPWKRKLFLALCRRYGLKPFREAGRRYSTVQVRAPKTFQERTLWPEFLALSKELHAHLEELTERVIREAIDEDVTEAAEAGTPKALPEGDGMRRGCHARSAGVAADMGSVWGSPMKSSGCARSMRSGNSSRSLA
jgi:hypothetical protein